MRAGGGGQGEGGEGEGAPDPRPGSSYLPSLCSLSISKRAQRPRGRVRRRARRKVGRTRSPRRTPCRRRPCSTRTTYPTGRWSSSPSAATSGKGRLRGRRRRRNESHLHSSHRDADHVCLCACLFSVLPFVQRNSFPYKLYLLSSQIQSPGPPAVLCRLCIVCVCVCVCVECGCHDGAALMYCDATDKSDCDVAGGTSALFKYWSTFCKF